MFDLQGYGWMLWDGLQVTLAVGLLAMALAVVLGLVGAWGKLTRNRFANIAAGIYTTVIRGVPELLLILLVYYGTPTLIQGVLARMGHEIVIDINPFLAGFVTIGFIYGAFATEVFRGAFLSLDRGQIEAGRAIGMNRVLVFRRIMLPQVWRFALPGLGNVWMVLIKATALISVIQLPELLRNADVAARAVREPFTFYMAACLIYLGITAASAAAQQWAERRAGRGFEERTG